MNPYQFNLHFGGSSYMDAETFVSCITDMNKIIHEINRELKQEKAVQLTVYPLKEGSVELWCGLLADNTIMGAVEQLVNKDRVEYAANIITIVAGYFQLKQYFKGKLKVEDANQIVQKDKDTFVVKSKSGDSVFEINATTVNIYQNNVIVDKAVSDMFNKLEQSRFVEDFKLADTTQGPLFKADKKEFSELAKPASPSKEVESKTDVDTDANIYVKKIEFSGSQKWDGIYNSHKISFKIVDKEFIEKLRNSEIRFNSSTIINCVLSIAYVFDDDLQEFIIDANNYRIEKVNSIKDASNQTEIQF